MDEPDVTPGDEDTALPEVPEGSEDFDLEHDGAVYRLPGALKGLVMAREELGQHLDALEAHRDELNHHHRAVMAHSRMSQQDLADRVRLHLLDEALGDFQGTDWEALGREDVARAGALWTRFQALNAARNQHIKALDQKASERRRAESQALSERMKATGEVLAETIEDWSPDHARKLMAFAQDLGLGPDELSEAADPRVWQLLHHAHEGARLKAEQASAAQVSRAQSLQPATQVRGSGALDPSVRDQMATRDWMARRSAQASGRI